MTKFGYKWFRNTVWKILNICCDRGRKRSNPIFSPDTLAYDGLSHSAKELSVWRMIWNGHILITQVNTVTIILQTATNFFTWPWLMRIHHHTKFGYKRLSSSEENFWTNHPPPTPPNTSMGVGEGIINHTHLPTHKLQKPSCIYVLIKQIIM